MKKKISKVFSVLLALSMLVALPAYAGTFIGTESRGALDASAWSQRLQNVPELVFRHCEQGIGYGLCPVYTGPSEDAFRMANGRACVATDYEMWEGGYDQYGWLLVYFEANDGTMNVGYIPPRYVRGFQSQMPVNDFDAVPVIAEKRIQITNNPMQGRSYFAVLDPGDEFFVIGQYNVYGNWWYIEGWVDNTYTRGFIEKDSSAFSFSYQDSDHLSVLVSECYDINGQKITEQVIGLRESQYVDAPQLNGYHCAYEPIYVSVQNGSCTPSRIIWIYESDNDSEANPNEYPPHNGSSGNSVVYPTEWDTQFRPGLTEKEYNLERYKDLRYVGDDNYGTPYVWLIYSSERSDSIPELTAFFPGSTISEIGVRNGCLKNATDYFRYARIQELEIKLFDSAGNVYAERMVLPDIYSTEYSVKPLSRTYTDIRKVEFFLKSFYYDENEDNGHKYLLYVSDIQFRQ